MEAAMARTSKGYDIGDLEYNVGPPGSSDAITGVACAAFTAIFLLGIYFNDPVPPGDAN